MISWKKNIQLINAVIFFVKYMISSFRFNSCDSKQEIIYLEVKRYSDSIKRIVN